MNSLALTDHGVMYGAIELIKICQQTRFKPLIGNEMYIINGDIRKTRTSCEIPSSCVGKKTPKVIKTYSQTNHHFHLKGNPGKEFFRPCINKDLLKEHKEGLIVTSACLAGEIPKKMGGKLEKARKVATWYKEVFGEDFYLEIQDHGSQEDRIVNVELVKLPEN
ncbi:PHP domain-containing protein [Cylindrospermopsis raciborskii DSH]|uniref:PHP domain-containing protein n=1 Tax=Cylindrospermopsis raciborskii TaxID=77022 RepID=UPI002EDBA338